MPRASKRKSDATNPALVKSSNVDSTRPTKKKTSKEVERLDSLFQSYANKSSGMIDPEGVEALCSDLGVEYTDVRILMLAWKMNAKKQGYFMRDEWLTGLQALGADNIKKLKTALTELEKEVNDRVNFEKFYSYAFRYCLTEDKQKCLDIDTICALLDLVLGPHFRTHVDSFTEFLKIQNDYKVMNYDQWMNFLRFCHEITFLDFQDYDANQAWPIILDNFVEWFREKATSA